MQQNLFVGVTLAATLLKFPPVNLGVQVLCMVRVWVVRLLPSAQTVDSHRALWLPFR